ncbi:hypothetical protein BT96DRAFT_1008073 [Gymnopus androsaceus JB14]|uniref:Uncharacterized protein n=1 Tax=Gymnopus androsaceus JB14 TaxID=1447944 RepID=A0A6A4GFT7_9AGAR|nr:hypothetical protein BT96DRAFT_1008073 [Gymnopus androsaceus JB14]
MLPTVTTTKTTAELIAEMATALEMLRQKEAKEKAQEEAKRREKEEAERKVEEQWKAPEAKAKKKKEIEERRKRLVAAADRCVSALNSVASTMVDAHPPKKIKKSKEDVNSEDDEKTEPKTNRMADAVGGDPSNSDPNANGSDDDADDNDKPALKKPKMEVCKCCTIQKEACVPDRDWKPKKKGESEAGNLPSELGCLDDWLACLERQVNLIGQLLQQILSHLPDPKDESGEATENEKDEEEKKRRVKEGKKKAP